MATSCSLFSCHILIWNQKLYHSKLSKILLFLTWKQWLTIAADFTMMSQWLGVSFSAHKIWYQPMVLVLFNFHCANFQPIYIEKLIWKLFLFLILYHWSTVDNSGDPKCSAVQKQCIQTIIITIWSFILVIFSQYLGDISYI